MAAGKPVVSTPVHDVQAMFGDIVAIAADPESFVAACRSGLAESAADRSAREARMEARVAKHSWDAAAAKIHRSLETVLDAKPARSAADAAKMAESDAPGPGTPGAAVVGGRRTAARAKSLRKVASAG